MEIVVDEVLGIRDIGFADLNVHGSANNRGKVGREDSANARLSVVMMWRSDWSKTNLKLPAPGS